MSMFENNNYDHGEDYQRYQDWKNYEKQLAKELEGYDHELDLLREQEADEHRAAEHEREAETDYLLGDYGMGPISRWKRMPWVPACEDVQEEEEEELTTGEQVVREAVSREDGWGGEEQNEMRQLAQVTVNGVYRYELEWLPNTNEVRVETGHFQDGNPVYCWYQDNTMTSFTLSSLLGIPEKNIRITGLSFFTGNKSLAALNYETHQFLRSTWRDYAEGGTAMQFNVEIVEDDNTIDLPPGKMCKNTCYDGACDGTDCEFKPIEPQVRPHGIDGTQCDCMDCVPDEFPPDPPSTPTELTADMTVGEVIGVIEKEGLGPLAKYMEEYMKEEDAVEPSDTSKPVSSPQDTLGIVEMHALALLAALSLYLLWIAYGLL